MEAGEKRNNHNKKIKERSETKTRRKKIRKAASNTNGFRQEKEK